MYAATSMQLDITFAVSILSQFMQNPGRVHWEAAKEVMRYLKGTANVKLTLGAEEQGLEAYVDSDWASQPHRHSMSGYTVFLHGAPVAWSSRKQTLIALSTAKAKYMTQEMRPRHETDHVTLDTPLRPNVDSQKIIN
jgi:hypothetical protein